MKEQAQSLYVLGQKIMLIQTPKDFDMAYVVTPVGMPGPPPHYHDKQAEFFYIISGSLEVMVGEEWYAMGPGENMEVAPGIVHTFKNDGQEDCHWVTTWSPKGFAPFFPELGIPVDEEHSMQRSLAEEIIQRVPVVAEKYGMIIPPVTA